MVKTGDHCVGCGNKARAKHGCEEFLPFFHLQWHQKKIIGNNKWLKKIHNNDDENDTNINNNNNNDSNNDEINYNNNNNEYNYNNLKRIII